MRFSIMFDTHIDKWDLAQYVEELGFDGAYFPDSEMIWSDCYAAMALAAANTKRIRLGTGIAAPGVRIAPVTAHSIATINQIAPGRVFLGIGTGHTSMRMLGQDPVSLAELREYVRVVRSLLDGDEVDYTYRGKTRSIKFLHLDRHFINIEDRIPIYIAANGPKAIALAGAIGDGWIVHTAIPDQARTYFGLLREGAKQAGRALPDDFHPICHGSVCVLRPGEKLTDERVINETATQVTGVLHLVFELWNYLGRKDEMIPPYFANIWDEYLKRVANYSLPPYAVFRQIHDGHFTFLQPEERRFVTPEAIRAICIVGEPDEVIARIREIESIGFKELNMLPPADYQRKVFRDVSELIMPAFR
jgi:alkanesulfonate monooxygenase SsuD/methylene tetrahydromethanopterin reductase-like flavin-dependent oxidoreductase (luciferase family)